MQKYPPKKGGNFVRLNNKIIVFFGKRAYLSTKMDKYALFMVVNKNNYLWLIGIMHIETKRKKNKCVQITQNIWPNVNFFMF